MNLRDRIKSEETESRPSENGKKNSESTTNKSRELLRDRALLKSQSETIQKLQTTIQNLSSENLTIKKELQKKSATVVSLNETIAMLSKSDLILRENVSLKKDNELLQYAVTAAEAKAEEEISAFKLYCRVYLKDAEEKYTEAVQRESEAAQIKADYETLIKREAERLAGGKAEELSKDYNDKLIREKKLFKKRTAVIRIVSGIGIAYGVVITAILIYIMSL